MKRFLLSLGSDISLNQNLLATYTKIAKSDKVLEQVINNLNLDISVENLSNLISITTVNNTEVFKIIVNNENSYLAANITNELLNIFSNEVKALYNMNNVYAVDIAEPNSTPYNINHTKDIFIFAMIGLVISFVLIFVIYLLDTTIKSEQDIEGYANLAVLSTIPIYDNKQDANFSELIVNAQPKSPIAECFKAFRTNVMFSIQNKKLNNILVTSGFMGEGKSFVSSNLAVTFAQSGKKVILLDTDMRKGRLHKIFGIKNTFGLSNLLSNINVYGNKVNINEYITKTEIPNLHIITSGNVPPNPSELLSSPNMKKVLEALNKQYDIVICDGTPCMLVSDSIILSKIVDTTVIVTANRITKIDTLLKIKKSIEIVGGNIGGTVLNKMNISSKSYQNKYYYGNHNEVNKQLEFNADINDSLINNVLCINDDITIENNNISNYNDENVINPQYNDNSLNVLSNSINNAYKEILELKNLYKNAMQNFLKNINKRDHNSNIILDKLNNIKASYESNIDTQNQHIASLEDKIANIKIEDNSSAILDKLNNIKASYESNIDTQNQHIASLEDKIANIKIEDNSSAILDELNNIKSSYESDIVAQNQHIASLEDKIANIKIEDNSNVILNELNNIKASYESNIDTQNQHIASLEDKIANIKIEDNSNVILNELNNIKASYESDIVAQNQYIASLEDKIANIKIEDNSNVILNELNNIKASYESDIVAQNQYIASLEDKIASIKIEDNSSIILDELNNIKASYESNIDTQNQHIASLEDKIANIKIEDNSSAILDELNNIKASYESNIDTQNQHIASLEDKIANIKIEDNSSIILNELNNIKASYESDIVAQNQYIASLEGKIASIKIEDNSSIILDELNNIKTSYESDIVAQNEYIASLEDKIANIKIEDNSSAILDELNNIKASYENKIEKQNNEIMNLREQLSKIKVPDNSNILTAISSINSQLEIINNRFSLLEKKSLDNEKLLKNINKSDFNNKNKIIDIKQSDEKIYKLQNYSETGYNANLNDQSKRKNKNILEGQINLIDNLLENTSSNSHNKTNNETFEKKINVIDYNKAKNKQKRGLFSFMQNRNVPEYDEEICIVSQILAGNTTESVS